MGIWRDARGPKPLWGAMFYDTWREKKAFVQVTEDNVNQDPFINNIHAAVLA